MFEFYRYIQSLNEVYGISEWFGYQQPIAKEIPFMCCQRSIVQRYVWEFLFYDQPTFSLKDEYSQYMATEQAQSLAEQLHDAMITSLRDLIAIEARHIEEIRFFGNDVFVLYREPKEELDDYFGVISHESELPQNRWY